MSSAARSPQHLLEAARAWQADDPDPATAAELAALIARVEAGGDRAAEDELADAFAGLLEFGTAGLRGALGAGPNRMNRAVVIRAAAGLAAHLRAKVPAGAAPAVVIGYDARHNSDVFAADTAAVMVAAGIEAMVLPKPLPTPVLAYAVRDLGTDAGVMVTASHNPPQDNGYKVYLGGRVCTPEGTGVQIVPPADAEIAAQIATVTSVASVPRADEGWVTLDENLVANYVDAATATLTADGPRKLSVVLTSLHGVGGATMLAALRTAGFDDVNVVAAQADPDPDFPTVSFPNPEEPGAIDAALALARQIGADLVIANDPDADRCAVAVPDPSTAGAEHGGWRMLRGDELGALLGLHLIRRGTLPETADGVPATMANSIVSGRLLARIAQAHGLRHAQTLTGFKWIARVPGLVFGYEEAIGYCVAPQLVRDKDGISAGITVAEMAAGLKAAGRTLLDDLDDLARRFGVHATDQLSLRVADLALIGEAMARLRAHPPAELAGSPVVVRIDLAAPDAGDPAALPPTDGLHYETADGLRVIVRPSGTEPKLKCYLEAVVPVGPEGLDAARADAATVLASARSQLREALALD